MQKAFSHLFQVSLCTVGYLLANSDITLAQVTPDATVNTQVEQNGGVAEITGGETRGDNLFHSFQDFSVPTGNEAFFDNANNISNIFSRVTGGNVSNIDGAIRANGSASLFLINPAGIIFGENARLDIGGSFYGSTASSILFEDGEFSAADLDNPPLLTVNAPIGLGFRDNPGDITFQASSDENLAEVGNTISLIGGNINLEGGIISAPGGNIQLGSLTSAGEISIGEDGSLSFPDTVARGDVSLKDASKVGDSTDESSSIDIIAKNLSVNSNSSIENGSSNNSQLGDIAINLTEDLIVDAGGVNGTTAIFTINSGTGNLGNIEINARNIDIFNGGQISISNSLSEGVTGSIGNVDLVAQNLTLTNGAVIFSNLRGNGNSSDINLNIADTIKIDGVDPEINFPSSITSSIGASGNGTTGNITINTQNLVLSDQGSIIGTNAGQGSVGDIDINVNSLEITGGSRIDGNLRNSSEVENPITPGNVSNINISATDSVSIIGNSEFFSFIDASVLTEIVEDAGNITINTPLLLIDDAFISADVIGNGNGGEIDIDVTELSVINNSFISADVIGNGNGGEIDIQAKDFIELSNLSLIQANSLQDSTGNAGDLTIDTGRLIVEDASQIGVTTNGDGNAGNLTVMAESIDLSGANEDLKSRSGLFAKATIGNGNAGNLTIITEELNISNGAAVEAGNFPSFEDSETEPGIGESGTINIQANSINIFDQGRIDGATQSATGEGGNINLQVEEDITLRNNSFISAQAFSEGNGGNLSVDTRFIIAFPSNGNGNDIIAIAEQGNGGNITINVESLFGISEGLAVEGNGTNDIDASSQFNLDGNVTIDTPDINPIQGTTELPSNIVVPEQTTAQACQANREIAAKNGLTIKGKGGVPPAPGLAMDSHHIYINGEDVNSLSGIPPAIATSNGKIQPARGIRVSEDGGIVLTAYRTNNSGERLPAEKQNCDR